MHKTKTTTRQIETLYRNFEVRSFSEENRTVELSFSSEIPYERYWGIEILDHSPTSVNLSRLNSAAPLLLDHDTRNQIGVVESAAISSERKGVATVRFSRSERGDEIFQDVVDGIRKNVSVGYQIEEMMLESREGDTETFRVTKWMPFEVSIVSVPADNSVGIGRANDESRSNVTMQVVVTTWVEDEEEDKMENENIDPVAVAPVGVTENGIPYCRKHMCQMEQSSGGEAGSSVAYCRCRVDGCKQTAKRVKNPKSVLAYARIQTIETCLFPEFAAGCHSLHRVVVVQLRPCRDITGNGCFSDLSALLIWLTCPQVWHRNLLQPCLSVILNQLRKGNRCGCVTAHRAFQNRVLTV